jgi:hypothetical protein
MTFSDQSAKRVINAGVLTGAFQILKGFQVHAILGKRTRQQEATKPSEMRSLVRGEVIGNNCSRGGGSARSFDRSIDRPRDSIDRRSLRVRLPRGPWRCDVTQTIPSN